MQPLRLCAIGMQETVSKNIVNALDKWRDMQEAASESLFLAIYGSPALQAAVGINPDAEVSPKPQMSAEHRHLLEARIAELKSQISRGGLRECVIRGLLYVGMTLRAGGNEAEISKKRWWAE